MLYSGISSVISGPSTTTIVTGVLLRASALVAHKTAISFLFQIAFWNSPMFPYVPCCSACVMYMLTEHYMFKSHGVRGIPRLPLIPDGLRPELGNSCGDKNKQRINKLTMCYSLMAPLSSRFLLEATMVASLDLLFGQTMPNPPAKCTHPEPNSLTFPLSIH